MHQNIDLQVRETVRRTQRYWYIDGLNEAASGVVISVVGLLLVAQSTLPEESMASNMITVSIPLVIIGLWWLSAKAVNALKEGLTYPRTGYVAYPNRSPKERSVRALAAMTIAMCVASGMMVLAGSVGLRDALPVVTGLIASGTVFWLGYRFGLARFYVVAAVTALLSILVSFMRWESELSIGALLTGFGLVWLVSGLLTLAGYVRQTKPDDQEAR